MVLTESPTIKKYKDTITQCIRMYYPNMDSRDIDKALDYSINKRFRDSKAHIDNSYTHKIDPNNKTLLAISDYITDRQPIVTAFGTMFMRHGTVPNPLAVVVQSFMDNRSKHKKIMFKYPRGSEEFEKYNLLQSLTDQLSRDLFVVTQRVKPS